MKTYHLDNVPIVIYLDRQGTHFENDTVLKYTGTWIYPQPFEPVYFLMRWWLLN